MTGVRIFALSIGWLAVSSSVISAQDLSKYRDFQLGTSLAAVAQQAGIVPDARVLHQRPQLIQELMWQPPHNLGSSTSGDSVRKVLFSFYNGELFRVVVNYDWDKTEGLTVDDMVEAIRLDELGAPQRAIDRKQKQEDDDHARQQKARLLNKAIFRP